MASQRFTNRLIGEDSPYLRQHAHNPVDWYPWCADAFAAARRLDRPVFLSIGYSTCHWCHVMEVESFDDAAIAAWLNAHFISIKLDREQRPDIDDIYMTGVQITTGHGGWPMSNFLTPEGRPFFAGTYFPPAQFLALMQRITQAWQQQREALQEQAERLSAAIAQAMSRSDTGTANLDAAFARAEQLALDSHDANAGGFGRAPKFPHEPLLLFLLARTAHEPRPALLNALHLTLRRMAQGGIHDQIGGGFHRYSVDAEWRVPHFEKMLYNQAALLRAYLEAYRLSADKYLRQVAEEIIAYVLRDMRSPEGLFFSATDADSEGEEGRFFVWTATEMDAVLPGRLAELVKAVYGITPHGNFEGANIPFLVEAADDYARRRGQDYGELLRDLEHARRLLYAARELRIHPLRDEKIIVAWNGMMIGALAEAATTLGRADCLVAARIAAETLWQRHGAENADSMWRISLDGRVSVPALQEDYAYFCEALLVLFDASGDPIWLERTRVLLEAMDRLFLDTDGAWFQSRAEQDVALLARSKGFHDGAMASGNAVALQVIGMLHRRTGDYTYLQRFNRVTALLAGDFEQQPQACAYSLRACDLLTHGEWAPVQWAAAGRVRVAASARREAQTVLLSIELRLHDGLHVYRSDDAEQTVAAPAIELPPDSVGWLLLDVDMQADAIADTESTRLAGTVALRARFAQQGNVAKPLRIVLRLQVCGEGYCLAPEQLHFVLAVNL